MGEGESVQIGAPSLLAPLSNVPWFPTVVTTRSRFSKCVVKHYQKHQGHRQNYTELRIDSIAA